LGKLALERGHKRVPETPQGITVAIFNGEWGFGLFKVSYLFIKSI
jgi:hypothetical protein